MWMLACKQFLATSVNANQGSKQHNLSRGVTIDARFWVILTLSCASQHINIPTLSTLHTV